MGRKFGVVFTKLEVEVQADYDSRPNHGVTADPPGYRQIRYIVTVENDAPEAEVMRVLDQADACSPLRDDFARALDVRRQVNLELRTSNRERRT